MGMKQKKFKTADSKKARFSKSPILKIFSRKFLRLVLGLVGLNDAKGIDVAQRIWPWGCPTKAQKQPKSTEKAFFGCFWAFVSVCFLVQMKTSKSHSEINWPLATIIIYSHVFKLIIHEFEDFWCFWPLMALIGVDWPFWPLFAFRVRVVFLSKKIGR